MQCLIGTERHAPYGELNESKTVVAGHLQFEFGQSIGEFIVRRNVRLNHYESQPLIVRCDEGLRNSIPMPMKPWKKNFRELFNLT